MTEKLTTPEPEHDEDAEREQSPWNKIEDSAFPLEFLDCMIETSHLTVVAYLEKINAPQELTDLLEVMCCLNMEYVQIAEGKGKTKNFNNKNMMDWVASASRLIIALGGSFYTESGQVLNPREKNVSEKVQAQIEDILQRSDSQPKKPRRKKQ